MLDPVHEECGIAAFYSMQNPGTVVSPDQPVDTTDSLDDRSHGHASLGGGLPEEETVALLDDRANSEGSEEIPILFASDLSESEIAARTLLGNGEESEEIGLADGFSSDVSDLWMRQKFIEMLPETFDLPIGQESYRAGIELIDSAFELPPKDWFWADRGEVSLGFVLALGSLRSARKKIMGPSIFRKRYD